MPSRKLAGGSSRRAGQPTKAVVHISFGQLRRHPGASVFEEEYLRWAAGQWAARRGAASVLGSDGAVWLDGPAADAAGCDTMTVPVVIGTVDWQALDEMAALCVELAGYHAEAGAEADAEDGERYAATGDDAGTGGEDTEPGVRRVTPREALLRQKILAAAADLLSGPGGMASVLRTGVLGTQLGSRSLPLDIGYSEEIPAAIRRAVILRDKPARSAPVLPCRSPARCTTSCTRRTAAPPPSKAASCCATSTTRS
jgi:hypothetical protein